MFEYLRYKTKFLMKLDTFIAHEIIKEFIPNIGLKMRSPNQLNQMNRYILANEFYNTLNIKLCEGSVDGVDMKDDIAIYIDKIIPQSYGKWKIHELNNTSNQIIINAEDFGLIYHFEENKN